MFRRGEYFKVRESEAKRLRAVYPVIVNAIKRAGGCVRRTDIEKSYGEPAVKLALQENIISKTTVVSRCKSLSRLDERIEVLTVIGWSGERPAWLDE